MKIGYARVSTGDQNLDLQRDALRAAGCERIYEEKLSGVERCRPALNAALGRVGSGDVLIVWKLDRMGRSLQDLIKILGQLEEQGVEFRSLSDSIDTTTPTGRLVFHVTGAMAEFERCLMSERTKAGLAAAQRNGRRLGRPPRLSKTQVARARVLRMEHRLTYHEIAKRLSVGKTTVWRAVSAPEQERCRQSGNADRDRRHADLVSAPAASQMAAHQHAVGDPPPSLASPPRP